MVLSKVQADAPQSDANPQPNRRDIVLGLVGFGVFLALLTTIINAIGIERLQVAIQAAGIFAPLIYIAIKALTNIIAPLSSGPIQLAAGTLFDSVLLGGLYTLIGEVIGGCVNFWIARRWGRPTVARLVGEKGMQRIDHTYDERLGGWRGLFAMRLLLFSVWDFVSYAAGLAQSVRFSHYFWASTLAGAVPTFAFVWLGNAVLLSPQNLVFIYVTLVLVIISTLILWERIAKAFGESSA